MKILAYLESETPIFIQKLFYWLSCNISETKDINDAIHSALMGTLDNEQQEKTIQANKGKENSRHLFQEILQNMIVFTII